MSNSTRSALLRQSIRLLIVFSIAALFLGCGGNPTDPVEGDADTGVGDLDTDVGDGDGDAGDGDVDGDGDGTTDPDTDQEPGDEDGDVEPVETHSDYMVCNSDIDCPINGSECVRFVPFNRPGFDGVDEAAISDLFEELATGQGVCSRPCSTDPTVCDTVLWPDDRGAKHPSSCVVVATGLPPYIVESLDPFEVTVDLHEIREGQAFGAICMPPLDVDLNRPADFCHSCTTQAQCGQQSECYNFLTGALRENSDELGQSFCLQHCDDDQDCPLGFDCLAGDGDDAQGVCVPASGTCTDCIDHDEDGFGTGHCGPAHARQTAYDCDDSNPNIFYDPDDVYHSFPAHCGAFDFNCDGLRDDLQMIGSENWGNIHCQHCEDSCEGPTQGGILSCALDEESAPFCSVGCEAGRANCNGDWSDGCEVDMLDPDYLYWQDADNDGFGDDALGPQFFCTFEEAATVLLNPVQQGGDCDDEDAETFPGAPELCNGKTNDCTAQNPIVGVLDGNDVQLGDACIVPGAHGACTEGEVACGETNGQWGLFCEQTVFPAAFETCNGLDDTCNGLIDQADNGDVRGQNGVEQVGDGCDTGLLGECQFGEKQCVAQGTGIPVDLTCTQTVFPQLEAAGFDGIDHSCDGFDRYAREDGTPHAIFVRPASGISLGDAIQDAATSTECALTVNTVPEPTTVRCDVFVQASGSHVATSTISLQDGIDIYGGFPADFATWTVGDSFTAPSYTGLSPSTRVTVQAPANGDPVIGLLGDNIENPTHIYGLEIVTQSVNPTGENRFCSANLGAVCRNCEGLRARQFYVQAGNAGPGANGSNGGNGANGQNGATNNTTNLNNSFCARGGTSPIGHHGGDSGRCGDSSVAQRYGWPGLGSRGGDGGTSGNRDGRNGGGGEALTQPEPLTTYGALTNWLTSECERNYDGAADATVHGSGGGGAWVNSVSTGHLTMHFAAGGGGGGQAGSPGTGGVSGAPSIGFLLVDTDGGVVFNSVRFQSGNGGAGGAGGNGGDGGEGGNRGSENGASGGRGGHGAGGNGGNGGNGGPSIAFVRHNATVSQIQGETFATGSGGSGGSGGTAGNGMDSSQAVRASTDGNNGRQGRGGITCRTFEQSAQNGGGAWPLTFSLDGCVN